MVIVSAARTCFTLKLAERLFSCWLAWDFVPLPLYILVVGGYYSLAYLQLS